MDRDGPKWGRERFFPTNPDLANILGDADFNFENFCFWDLFRSQIPQISKFPGWASSILLQYFCCHRYVICAFNLLFLEFIFPASQHAIKLCQQMTNIRDVPCRAVPRSGGSVPCGSGGLPEIWGPFFWGKKKTPAATYPQAKGFQKYGALFVWEKKRLRQRTHKLGASRNTEGKGETCTPPLGQGFRTAWHITGQKLA